MAKKKKTTGKKTAPKRKVAPKKAIAKEAIAKKAASKKAAKKAAAKKAAPKKAALPRHAIIINNKLSKIQAGIHGLEMSKPICKTEKITLGTGCMDSVAAVQELQKHLATFPDHDVDAVPC